MVTVVGEEKGTATALYDRALHAPTKTHADLVTAQYGRKTAAYLSKWPHSQLYMSSSDLEDGIFRSSGPESQNAADIKNLIRSVQPQEMAITWALKARSNFYGRKHAALGCTGPVPPRVEQRLAALLLKAKAYMSSVAFTPNTNRMEATVVSLGTAGGSRLVRLPTRPHIAPECCAYAGKNWLPCYHGVAVIVQKHGEGQLYRFIPKSFQTAAWKAQYDGVECNYPSQADIDLVNAEAKALVESGNALHQPVALPPPRGRPRKNAGQRFRSFFERGPTTCMRRIYLCALCRQADHTRVNCPLKQSLEDLVDDGFTGDNSDDNDAFVDDGENVRAHPKPPSHRIATGAHAVTLGDAEVNLLVNIHRTQHASKADGWCFFESVAVQTGVSKVQLRADCASAMENLLFQPTLVSFIGNFGLNSHSLANKRVLARKAKAHRCAPSPGSPCGEEYYGGLLEMKALSMLTQRDVISVQIGTPNVSIYRPHSAPPTCQAMPIGSVDRLTVAEDTVVLFYDGVGHWNGAVPDA